MKTKEEILKQNGLQVGFKSTYSWDAIIAAMEEYAQQAIANHEAKRKLKLLDNAIAEFEAEQRRKSHDSKGII